MIHHLEDLISDCDPYRWEKVRAYHGFLLNQMEQGLLSWAESDQILKFCRALVWHSPSPSNRALLGIASPVLHFIRAPEVPPDSRGIQCSSQAEHHSMLSFQPGVLQNGGRASRPAACVFILPGSNKPGRVLYRAVEC